MGHQHVSNGRIRVRQQKTGTHLWIKMHSELAGIIAQTPRDNLTFLVTAYGKPFSAAGFGNWFRECCDSAGPIEVLGSRSAQGRCSPPRRSRLHQSTNQGHHRATEQRPKWLATRKPPNRKSWPTKP